MKKALLLFSVVLYISACAPRIKLNRLSGRPGPYAPIVEKDTVTFQIHVPQASLVTLAGNFNGWDSQITPMQTDTNGIWSIRLPLKPGVTYQYKFVVDGYWIADPDNPHTESDGNAGQISIITIPAEEK